MTASTKSTKGKKNKPTVTRIKANDSSAPKRTAAVKSKQNAAAGATTKSTSSAKDKPVSKAKKLLDSARRKPKSAENGEKSTSSRRSPLRAIRSYFVGAWQELRQVRWPDRRSTWAMTGALIAFTVVFVIVILLIDYGFSWLFKLIIGTK